MKTPFSTFIARLLSSRSDEQNTYVVSGMILSSAELLSTSSPELDNLSGSVANGLWSTEFPFDVYQNE
jgi:hypothetical protein